MSATRRYWTLVAVLIVFGAITGFGIGLPFLFLGITLAVLKPHRRRPAIFWPPLAGLVALALTFVLVAPLSCSTTSTSGGPSSTTCTNLIGLDYSGDGGYNPNSLPALALALTAGLVVAAVSSWLIARTSKS